MLYFKMKITKKIFKEIQKNPLSIDDLNEEDIANIIREASNYYYNKNESVLSDDLFDIIKEKLEKLYPNNPVLKEIGAKIEEKLKVKLPYFLGSLDKIKTDSKVLERWVKKHPGQYVLSDKLDGISALYHIKDGKKSLYTRGDGKNGMDISRMIQYINNIPKNITSDITVRGELIISKKKWDKIKDQGSNPRNMVSGIFNSKKPNLVLLNNVDFIAYQVLSPERVLPSRQFEILQKNGFQAAQSVTHNSIDINILSNYLNDRRLSSDYEIDGIVVKLNVEADEVKSGNPKDGFAFKNIITDASAEVIVTSVEWTISKHGAIVPVVVFPAVNIGGVTVQRSTGFNAKFIKDNLIGPGSKLLVIRSGQVIPYITTVLKASNTGQPMLPDNIPYEWNKTGVDIIVTEKSDELDKKILCSFFEKVKVKGVSTGIINKLYDNGYNTISKVLKITIHELLTIDGVKQKSAQNIYNALHEITLDNCVNLMAASTLFGKGFGERKLKLIIDNLPNHNVINKNPTLEQLIAIKGINEISALQFINSLHKFRTFLEENNFQCKFENQEQKEIKSQSKKKSAKQNLEGMSILFTGFRNKEMEEEIENRGGELKQVLTGKVTILIIKDATIENKKTEKATELGVEIFTQDKFKNKYFT